MNKKLALEKDALRPNEIVMKKSVRTTFKIADVTNENLRTLLHKLEIKPKELLDEICSNEKLIQLIESIISQNENYFHSTLNRRKTLVISKFALQFLSRKSSELKISRDILFNNIILTFKIMLDKVFEEEREKEQKASEIVNDFWDEAEKIEQQLTELLGKDNPITQRFGLISTIIMDLSSAIDNKLTKGKPIDPNDFSQS